MKRFIMMLIVSVTLISCSKDENDKPKLSTYTVKLGSTAKENIFYSVKIVTHKEIKPGEVEITTDKIVQEGYYNEKNEKKPLAEITVDNIETGKFISVDVTYIDKWEYLYLIVKKDDKEVHNESSSKPINSLIEVK